MVDSVVHVSILTDFLLNIEREIFKSLTIIVDLDTLTSTMCCLMKYKSGRIFHVYELELYC